MDQALRRAYRIDVAEVLADADPKLKAQLHSELGFAVKYDPNERTASACATVRVGGGLTPFSTRPWDIARAA